MTSAGTDGILYKTVIDDTSRAEQKKFFDERAKRGIAAPGEGADIFNIVAEWDDHLRFRHLADGLAEAGWSSGRIEKVLGGQSAAALQRGLGHPERSGSRSHSRVLFAVVLCKHNDVASRVRVADLRTPVKRRPPRHDHQLAL
ncbi:MAG: rane dipeptidase [Gammaproteobacteria bacterium]|nr:rane dipeptidase [Gammaproteobacteria bacterium]